jgi:aspartokinase
VRRADSAAAVSALQLRFGDALGAGRISGVRAIDDCCVLAAVGQQMASRRGVAATMFDALAKANVNIRRVPPSLARRAFLFWRVPLSWGEAGPGGEAGRALCAS